MKNNYQRSILISAIVLFVAFTTFAITSASAHKRTNICGSTKGSNHMVILHAQNAIPSTTTGKLCDTVTFINKDNITLAIAFGPHENHVPYDGVSERLIGNNQSFSITLNKIGIYHFHDHIHDQSMGFFIVQ